MVIMLQLPKRERQGVGVLFLYKFNIDFDYLLYFIIYPQSSILSALRTFLYRVARLCN